MQPPVATQMQPPVLIAVMGMTGTGKSTFLSTITGQDVKIGHGLESCTQDIGLTRPIHLGGRDVVFVDTPGFDDTDRSDADVLQMIATYLETHCEDVKLSGLIYLHRITDTRMGGSATKNLKMFRHLCGDKNLGNVVLATTRWEEISLVDGEAREKQMVATGKFWYGMKSLGAAVERHNGTQESAERIATKIVNKTPIVLQIQEELKLYGKLSDTAAGKEVMEDVEKARIAHEKELAEIKEQMQEAFESQNNEMMAATRAMHEQTVKEMRKNHEDSLKLNEERMKLAEKEMSEKARERTEFMDMMKEKDRRADEKTAELIRLHRELAEANANSGSCVIS